MKHEKNLPKTDTSAEGPITAEAKQSPREAHGISRLREALSAACDQTKEIRLIVGRRESKLFVKYPNLPAFDPEQTEAFLLKRIGNDYLVIGSGPSGVLYGCLELARRIKAQGKLPAQLDLTDSPKLKLRGSCIGMVKTEITYDGAMYDYRYTLEDFPFFYDRREWIGYLDFLLENRLNSLYLWNGHPFTSLLKLPEYPDAQELSNTQLEKNIETFRWLAEEADKRGIWVIQFFYNIHISHAMAKARGVPFHHQAPNELVSAYTRHCISEFIRNYPNVGLLVTLGEALQPQYGAEWLTGTIIPGVKDGMRALGMTKEPPIIVRAHATEIETAMKQSLPLYRNIHTMHKYNGESLTWTDVRGEVRRMHEMLIKLGSEHIVNVHLLANLEPFRWGSPDFIQKVLQSCARMGVKGLHLYPLRYWEWPIAADHTNPPLKQIDRDWIWFEAWARYAWNPDRDREAEREYWIDRLVAKYGAREAGEHLLAAYELSGVCAPRMLPRVGITEGNRQAFSLGMLMTQLINPARYIEFPLTWEGGAPPGERLSQWVEREWERKPHEGETPPGVAEEVAEAARCAVAAAEAAGAHVTRDDEEYRRLLHDMRCIETLMKYYRAKIKSAALVLRYGYSRDLEDLKDAGKFLEKSLSEYRRLVVLTDQTYRQACSVHSLSRRIPFLGGPGKYTHWRDCLPAYESELSNFRRNLSLLAAASAATKNASWSALPAVPVKLSDGCDNLGKAELFEIRPGAKIYPDREWTIEQVAPELLGLTGIRINYGQATKQKGIPLSFELSEPAQILVGFFRGSMKSVAAYPPPNEWEPILRSAVLAGSHPVLTVYSAQLPAGRNELNFGGGAFTVLGFIKRDAQPMPRMVFYSEAGTSTRADLDWLFE
jgi:hypothetical protein